MNTSEKVLSRLSDLEEYNPITIQCHDNPDADALASGFGLYLYFTEKGNKNDIRNLGFSSEAGCSCAG